MLRARLMTPRELAERRARGSASWVSRHDESQVAPEPVMGEMLDTTPEARRFYYRKLAELTAEQRLRMVAGQTRLSRQMAEAGIRREHPGIGPQELRARLAVRLYGREVVERVLRELPDDAR